MKDWQRSPEPPAMMGIAGPSSPTSDLLPGAYYAPPLAAVPSEGTHNTAPTATRRTRPTDMTLSSMATRVILRNINLLNSVGDMPYRIARPLLVTCRADQLSVIEENSPHLQGNTEELWQRLVISDFLSVRKEQEAGTFKQPKSWRRMYLKLKGKEEQAKEAAGARLREKSAALKAEKDARKVIIADSMASIKLGKKKPFGSSSSSSTPLTRGQNMMTKARQAGMLRGRLTTPSTPLPTAIVKPASPVTAHHTSAAALATRPTLVVRGGGASMSIGGPAGRSMQTLHDRIKTLESPPSAVAPRPCVQRPAKPAPAPARPRLNAADLVMSNSSYTTKSRSQVEKEKGDAVLLSALGTKRRASDSGSSSSAGSIRITTLKRPRVEEVKPASCQGDGGKAKSVDESVSATATARPAPPASSRRESRQQQAPGPSIFMPRQRVV